MKFFIFTLIFFSFFIASFGATISHHHIYFGPEFLGYQLNTSIQNIDVSGTRFFWGFRLGYEYLCPNSFYGSLDILGTSSTADFKTSQNDIPVFNERSEKGFGNIELRAGYTFSRNFLLFTPFLAFGTYNLFQVHHNQTRGLTENFPYVAGGLRIKGYNRSICNLGLNVKIFHTISAQEKYRSDTIEITRYQNIFGGEIGMPLNFYFGCCQSWNLTLEPYYLGFATHKAQNIYGARALLGYHW